MVSDSDSDTDTDTEKDKPIDPAYEGRLRQHDRPRQKPLLMPLKESYPFNPTIWISGNYLKVVTSQGLNDDLGRTSRERSRQLQIKKGPTQYLSPEADSRYRKRMLSVDTGQFNWDSTYAVTLNYPRKMMGEQINACLAALLKSLRKKYGRNLAGAIRREIAPTRVPFVHEHGTFIFEEKPKGFQVYLRKRWLECVRKVGGNVAGAKVHIKLLRSPKDYIGWIGYAYKTDQKKGDKRAIRDSVSLPGAGNWIHYFPGILPRRIPTISQRLTASQFMFFVSAYCARYGIILRNFKNLSLTGDAQDTEKLLNLAKTIKDEDVPWPMPKGVEPYEYCACVLINEQGVPDCLRLYYGLDKVALVDIPVSRINAWSDELRSSGIFNSLP